MLTKYDNIGTGYNSTRKADPYLTEKLFSLLRPQRNKMYLDVGCGTGNYACALAGKGFHFTGVDPSEKMLSEAKAQNENITWLLGTAEQIPTEDSLFDGVIATLTIHHWENLKQAFAELNRVLAHSGRIVIFTSTPEQMNGYWLNHYFPKMLRTSIAQMPSLEDLEEAMLETGFKINKVEKYFVKDDLQDWFLYAGKNNPEYYFDEHIRHGISSFSSLANIEEVNEGLVKLKIDLENGIFEKIKNKFENELGDYLFVTMDRKNNIDL